MLFKVDSFLQCSCRLHIDTHTFCWEHGANTSLNNFCYKIQYQYTHPHMLTHCVFASCLLPSGFPRRCQVWHHHPASLGAPKTPAPSSLTPRCCMSVSQCNLQFHVRLGSNDHNNNGNNSYNNNLLLCVCTVPGWCSVQFSLSLEGRERG